MTWHNLPCPPTIPALLAACPHGFAELTVAHHAGNPTADPPQDADTSVEIDRLWGVDMPDIGLIEGLATAIVAGDVAGVPRVDCTLLARIEHGRAVCSECDREKPDDHKDWRCDPREDDSFECPGAFVTPVKVSANWGPDGAPVYFEGAGGAQYVDMIADLPIRPILEDFGAFLMELQGILGLEAAGVVPCRKILDTAIEKLGRPRAQSIVAISDIEADVDLMPAEDAARDPRGAVPAVDRDMADPRDRVYREMLDGKGPDGCGIQKG